jgi:hypothetical protein
LEIDIATVRSERNDLAEELKKMRDQHTRLISRLRGMQEAELTSQMSTAKVKSMEDQRDKTIVNLRDELQVMHLKQENEKRRLDSEHQLRIQEISVEYGAESQITSPFCRLFPLMHPHCGVSLLQRACAISRGRSWMNPSTLSMGI